MSWSLTDAMNGSLPLTGGTAYDVAPMIFPTQVANKIKQSLHGYVAAMRLANKTPECIRISVADYNKLGDAVAKVAGVKRADISGLRHDGIPVIGGRAS